MDKDYCFIQKKWKGAGGLAHSVFHSPPLCTHSAFVWEMGSEKDLSRVFLCKRVQCLDSQFSSDLLRRFYRHRKKTTLITTIRQTRQRLRSWSPCFSEGHHKSLLWRNRISTFVYKASAFPKRRSIHNSLAGLTQSFHSLCRNRNRSLVYSSASTLFTMTHAKQRQNWPNLSTLHPFL